MFDSFSKPLLFAHRGASSSAPENTLEAFELAYRLGIDVLECDLHLSKDGRVMIFHDSTLERTTNRKGFIRNKTYKELSLLDAGYHFRNSHGEYTFRGRGVYIPTLEELISAFPHIGFNLELKHSGEIVFKVLSILKDLKPSHVLINSSDDKVMTELESAKIKYPLGLSRKQVIKVIKSIYTGKKPTEFSGRALQIPTHIYGLPFVNRFFIERVHQAGLEVHLWTINSLNEAIKFLHQGADGIMTDNPDKMLSSFIQFRDDKNQIKTGK